MGYAFQAEGLVKRFGKTTAYSDGSRVWGVGHLTQRLTSPEHERLPQPARGVFHVDFPQCTPALSCQMLKPREIYGIAREVETVTAGGQPYSRLVRNSLTQPRDQRLRACAGSAGRSSVHSVSASLSTVTMRPVSSASRISRARGRGP